MLPDAPLGYLTAYHLKEKRRSRAGCAAVLEHPVELWPRMLRREPHLAAIELFDPKHNHHPYLTTLNVRKLLDTRRLMDGRPLPRSFCRSMLTLPQHETLDSWLENLPKHANATERCQNLVEELHGSLEPDHPPSTSNSRVGAAPTPLTTHHSPLTFHHTTRRSFEVAYWKNIAELSEGRYLNKNNADCVYDPVTRMLLDHPRRDLAILGDHLLTYYNRVIAATRMSGKALAGDLPFRWQSEFDYPWFGGWTDNQVGDALERNLIVVIPGRDRRRAVIMADHYDTAYMADFYEKEQGGSGARLAAAGADDNHSATVAMMLGAGLPGAEQGRQTGL